MMYRKIRLVIISMLFLSNLHAQDLDKMNKSELKEQLIKLTSKIDSLKYENSILEESKSIISEQAAKLLKENQHNEIEISRINELIVKKELERTQLISENEIEIKSLTNTILILEDSILNTLAKSANVPISLLNNSNDFLNNYFFNQTPLSNNSFTLVLSKLVVGNKVIIKNNDYDYIKPTTLEKLPEILDANVFEYWRIAPEAKLIHSDNVSDYLVSEKKYFFDAKLPRIEILKNKLLTIIYNDGSEESFLFNATQSKDDDNNKRKVLQIELANEEVKENISNNDVEKDIVWRFFALENECYLALTLEQLRRLKVKLYSLEQGIEVSGDHEEAKLCGENIEYYRKLYKYVPTGEGIYLYRLKDQFMDSGYFVDPNEIVYLFKLK